MRSISDEHGGTMSVAHRPRMHMTLGPFSVAFHIIRDACLQQASHQVVYGGHNCISNRLYRCIGHMMCMQDTYIAWQGIHMRVESAMEDPHCGHLRVGHGILLTQHVKKSICVAMAEIC